MRPRGGLLLRLRQTSRFNDRHWLIDGQVLNDVDLPADPPHLDAVDTGPRTQAEVHSLAEMALVASPAVDLIDQRSSFLIWKRNHLHGYAHQGLSAQISIMPWKRPPSVLSIRFP